MLAAFFIYSSLKNGNEKQTFSTSDGIKQEVKNLNNSSIKKTKALKAPKSEHQHSSHKHGYSYKEELSYVKNIIKNLPESKADLLAFIQKENPLKDADTSAHSTGEALAQKAGSLKVLALRTLMEGEENKEALFKDLTNITRNSQDPTIVEISKAALKSLKSGRSLFKDFSDGVDTDMPE